MKISVGQLRKIIREVVVAGEAKPEDMRSKLYPEDNYRPGAVDYIGMGISPYPEDNYRPGSPYPEDNYRPSDAFEYIGMRPPKGDEEETGEGDEDADVDPEEGKTDTDADTGEDTGAAIDEK